MAYRIITEATADLNSELLAGLSEVTVIPMFVQVDGVEYRFGPGGNITTEEFYALLRSGKYASTSQINPAVYRAYFEEILKQGMDVLYLCFSSGLSSTIQSARMAISDLEEAYPDRKIILVDTLAASVGEGLFVMEAARKQSQGMELEALAAWLEEHKLNLCHWFTVDTFDHLKHGGRVSAASAAVGSLLGIKPLLHVDDNGKLVAMAKPRGQKKALQMLRGSMEKGWMKELSNQVIIGHGDSLEVAQDLKALVAAQFPEAEIHIASIGPIIGAHAGPGVLAFFFWGSNH